MKVYNAEYHRKRYLANKEKWKNPDGTWKTKTYAERREYKLAYYKLNKEKIQDYYKRKRKEKERIGSCPICRITAKLVHDHNHITKEWRDWICSQCNVMLGMAHDKMEVLNAGSTYLAKFQK